MKKGANECKEVYIIEICHDEFRSPNHNTHDLIIIESKSG